MKKIKYTKVFKTKPTEEQIKESILEAENFNNGKYIENYLETNGKVYLLDIRLEV